MNHKKHTDHIQIQDIYFAGMTSGTDKHFLSTCLRAVFHRRIPRREKHEKHFSLDFSATEIKWYVNSMNSFYMWLGGPVSCFFTDEGVILLIFMVYGDPNARDVLEMPEMKDEFLEDREATQRKKKKSLTIEKESVKEEVKEDGYHLQYEETYKDHGKEVKMFEHVVYSGVDKLVFRAIVPPQASLETFDDIVVIANSLRIK